MFGLSWKGFRYKDRFRMVPVRGQHKRRPRTWTEIARHHLGEQVSEAVCEANSCKLIQVLSVLMAGKTFSRSGRETMDWTASLSAFGKHLKHLHKNL